MVPDLVGATVIVQQAVTRAYNKVVEWDKEMSGKREVVEVKLTRIGI